MIINKTSVFFKLQLIFILGFIFPICGQAFQGTLIKKELADPTLFYITTKDSTASFYVMGGTGINTRVIPLYRSTNGLNFSFWKNYDPSSLDPEYNYCHLWAPEINQKQDGTYVLFFSGLRYKKSESCGSIDAVTLFNATAITNQLNFSTPDLFYPGGQGGAQSYLKEGCLDGIIDRSHCENTMRIDSDFFIDPVTQKQWIFYVWFGFDQAMNNISSFDIINSATTFTNRRPANTEEEGINEAPDVFYRAPYYYMIYSHGDFRNSYALSYSFSKNLIGLRQDPNTGQNSKSYSLMPTQFYPAVEKDCKGYSGLPVKLSGGHSSSIEINKKFYLYYSQSVLNYDGSGCHNFQSRDAYRTELVFLPDGRINNLYDTYVHWNTEPGYQYSLDIKTKDGELIAPCISAAELKDKSWVLIQGSCGSKKVDPSQMQSLRVCRANNNNWHQAICSEYTSILGTDVSVEIPPDASTDRQRDFYWEDLGSPVEYSFDVKEKNGTLYAPCLGPQILNNKTSISFDGQCSIKKLELSQLSQVRVCAADSGLWNQAVCTDWTTSLAHSPASALIWNNDTKKDIQFNWNSLGPAYTYSLDLENDIGKKYYPCIHSGIIGAQTSVTFKGQCFNSELALEKVRAARICAAKNNDWANAKCTSLIKINRVRAKYSFQF